MTVRNWINLKVFKFIVFGMVLIPLIIFVNCKIYTQTSSEELAFKLLTEAATLAYKLPNEQKGKWLTNIAVAIRRHKPKQATIYFKEALSAAKVIKEPQLKLEQLFYLVDQLKGFEPKISEAIILEAAKVVEAIKSEDLYFSKAYLLIDRMKKYKIKGVERQIETFLRKAMRASKHKVRYLAEIANEAADVKPSRAKEIIHITSGMLKTIEPGWEKTKAILDLAEALLKIEPEEAIKFIQENKPKEFDSTFDQIAPPIVLKWAIIYKRSNPKISERLFEIGSQLAGRGLGYAVKSTVSWLAYCNMFDEAEELIEIMRKKIKATDDKELTSAYTEITPYLIPENPVKALKITTKVENICWQYSHPSRLIIQTEIDPLPIIKEFAILELSYSDSNEAQGRIEVLIAAAKRLKYTKPEVALRFLKAAAEHAEKLKDASRQYQYRECLAEIALCAADISPGLAQQLCEKVIKTDILKQLDSSSEILVTKKLAEAAPGYILKLIDGLPDSFAKAEIMMGVARRFANRNDKQAILIACQAAELSIKYIHQRPLTAAIIPLPHQQALGEVAKLDITAAQRLSKESRQALKRLKKFVIYETMFPPELMYAQAAIDLALIDSQRAVNLAKEITNKEHQIMALFGIASSLLKFRNLELTRLYGWGGWLGAISPCFAYEGTRGVIPLHF